MQVLMGLWITVTCLHSCSYFIDVPVRWELTGDWRGSVPLYSVSSLFSNFQPSSSQLSLWFLITARCTLVQSAVLRSHVVCLSVCNVGEL